MQGRLAWLRREAFNAPHNTIACVTESIMQTTWSALPKFNLLNRQDISTPMWRAWHVTAFEACSYFFDEIIKFFSVANDS
jgi:hypothetical protein